MATNNYRESSLNSGYTDVSHLAPTDTALTGGESMSAGNSTTRPIPAPVAGAPGSAPVNPAPPGAVNDAPGLEIGHAISYTKKEG